MSLWGIICPNTITFLVRYRRSTFLNFLSKFNPLIQTNIHIPPSYFIFYVFLLNIVNKWTSLVPVADKSLARPGRKQARKHVRDARDFNDIEMRAVIFFFFFLQGKAPKEIHAILTEILACFLSGRAKDLSTSLYLFRKLFNMQQCYSVDKIIHIPH